jgi:hypothetical protein
MDILKVAVFGVLAIAIIVWGVNLARGDKLTDKSMRC